MLFIAGFYDASILVEATGHSLRGRFPHLRLHPIESIPHLITIMESIPTHISDIVLNAKSSDIQLNVLLASEIMPVPTYFVIPKLRIVTWHQLEDAYREWMENVYLPRNAIRMISSPMALRPVSESLKPLEVELIGSCSSQEVQLKFQDIARELGFETRSVSTIRNAPLAVARQESPVTTTSTCDRILIIIPPFRSMHPNSMDLYYYSTDFDLFLEESRCHLLAYLEAVMTGGTTDNGFVVGFVAPTSNPLGLFIDEDGPSNLKHFVQTLNNDIRQWCRSRPSTYFIDGDAIAAGVGKVRVDDGLVNFYGHRGYLLDYDGPLDADFPVTDFSVTKSYEIGIDLYLESLVQEILLRQIILATENKIKLVILDLDNTLWRGLASDMKLGSWEGRPLAIVEALLILKKRGILLAIASKNDEDFIREHWRDILGSYAVCGLGIPLSLDDFSLVRINFRPKAENISEILNALNVLPEHTVFIDDNPLERESAIAAFPALRTLGAEPNYIRRELLCSPYLQNVAITQDDLNRSESIKKRIDYWEDKAESGGGSYLDHLGLRCVIGLVCKRNSIAQERAIQLLNKTNQWSLNGRRVGGSEFSRYLSMDSVYSAEVTDSGSSYGTVAVMILSEDRKQIDHMAISCRVIGLGVDEAVASEMVTRFGPLIFAFAETDRNRAARTFFQSCGWEKTGDTLPVIEALEHPKHISSLWVETELLHRGEPQA